MVIEHNCTSDGGGNTRPPVSRRNHCRLCHSLRMDLVVPMAATPIGDHYITSAQLGIPQDRYPLDLYLCLDCGHIQNLDIVAPDKLFVDYLFSTGNSTGLLKHFAEYANTVRASTMLLPTSLVVEIGSNDGTLLKHFRDAGHRVLGVDPARSIAEKATEEEIPTLATFFTPALAEEIRAQHGPAHLIMANNVFAHIDDLAGVVSGIEALLADDGVFVFEASYLVDIVNHYLFDTVYHEHLSYHSILPLLGFFDRHGLKLVDVSRNPSKGGSIRGFVRKAASAALPTQTVVDLAENERRAGYLTPVFFRAYAQRIQQRKQAVVGYIDQQRAQGKTIAAYGASVTTTTLLWNFDLTRKICFIVDDNPDKHGRYSPGCHIPVVPSSELYIRRPDIVLILAWQYQAPIRDKHANYLDLGGEFVVPLPELQIFRRTEKPAQ